MSSSALIYIEYKEDHRADKWTLLNALFEVPGTCIPCDYEYRSTCKLEGKEYAVITDDSFQGYVRDFLRDEKPGYDLPSNISEGLRKEAERCQKLFERNSTSRTYRWADGKRCILLSELSALVDEKEKECQSRLLQLHEALIADETNRKLDRILARLSGEKEPEDEESEDHLETIGRFNYCLNEEMEEISYMKSFCRHVRWMAGVVPGVYPEDESIRIIYSIEY